MMKKTFSVAMALLMAFCCFTAVPLEVFAVTSVDGFTFELDSKGEAYILTGAERGLAGQVVVPDTYNGLPVTTIGNGAFTYCEEIIEITIPETVTIIEGVAFQKCTSLQTINLPKTIKSITSSAFNYCSSLENIKIDNSINGHGEPFIDKYGNETGEGYFVRDGVLFANYNTYVDNKLILRNINHNSLIKYPSGRTEAGYTIPSDIMEIQSEAFSSLVNLETIMVPTSVISFYVRSFRGLGEPHEKPLTIIMVHETYPSDISSKTFQNLYPGTQVVLKNTSIVEQFNSQYNKIVYDFLYDEPGVEFICREPVTCDHDSNSIVNASEGKCNIDGDIVCDICNTILATGHSYSDWITDKNASVYSSGLKHKECTECGEVLETAEIPQLKAAKPKLETIKNTSSGVEITWGKVSGADKYRVYRKTSKSEWVYIGSTKKIYYTDKTANSGIKYYYAIKARNEAGNSSLSSALSRYYLAVPTLNRPSSSSKGIGLRWSKVRGADGYIIYRKTGSGSYIKLKTEKGLSNLTYRDTSAKKGETYTYKVKAYKSKTYSAYSNAKAKTDKY